MQSLWQDARFGLRMLLKSPGFTAIAVLTLALGIGANTAIFSLMNQVLLRKLPIKNPNELEILRAPGPKTGHVSSDGDDTESFSYPMYKGLRDKNSVFSGILARYGFSASVSNHGQTDRAVGEVVSGNYFDVLGVQPAMGRLFTRDDDKLPSAEPYVVLSYFYWKHHFGGDPSILNKVLLINNVEMTVVGVSQAGFSGVQVGKTPDLFVPMMMTPLMTEYGETLDDWNSYWLTLLARRAPGVSEKQAVAGINAAYKPLLEEQLPQIKSSWVEKKRQQFLDKRIELASGAHGRNVLQRDSGTQIVTLFVMVGLVLLIACTNVANLVLARGAGRQREFAIRTAMGASRVRMIRQLLIESLLCAFGGGVAGILLGTWLMRILTPIVVENAGIQGLSENLDINVLGFAVAATVISGIFFGLIPAWRVTRMDVTDVIKDQGSTSSASVSHVGFRKVLVAGQVAFTMLLLAGAGLFVRSLWNLRNQDLGIKTDNVISYSVQPILNGYDLQRSIALFDQMRTRLAALPGVRSVGSGDVPTLSGDDEGSNITVEGGMQAQLPEDQQDVDHISVSANYFSTLGIPLLAGREFTESDGASSPKVAVVSEAMAKRFFPGRNAVGMHFAFGGGNTVPDILIVGVVKDVKQEHVSAALQPYVYIPYSQRPKLREMTFYVRTDRDPLLASASLQDVVRQLDPNLPVFDLKTLQRVVEDDLFSARMVATLAASFAVLAALLAALGIYGVLAYVVVQRTREIGIRMALGAAAGHVRLLILREVGLMVLLGVGVGLPTAYALARLSESELFGVHAGDSVVYASGLVLIVLIALAACFIPARRATRVDPLMALRYE
jgi:predicted permease